MFTKIREKKGRKEKSDVKKNRGEEKKGIKDPKKI